MKSDTQQQGGGAIASKEWLGGDARFDELMKRLRETGIGKSVSASEWCEVEDFINENIRPEGVVNQEEWDRGHKAGVASGRAEIKTWLINKAADAFKAGKDEDAKRLRELANTVAS
jgi:hypothetical protein